MAAGKSPIVEAIERVELQTTGEIRVHISRRWFERDPFARAEKLFHRFGMTRTTYRNAVLLYVNLRRHKFAIVGDEGIHKVVGQEYWDGLAKALVEDLKKMKAENAIALAVTTVGATLARFFPSEATGPTTQNELSNEVTED